MSRNPFAVSAVAWLCFVFPAAGERQALATVTTLTDTDATSANAKYQTTHNADVTVNYASADAGSQQGTITFSATWPAGDLAARAILFNQTDFPTGDFGESKGGRFQIELSLINNSGVPWTGFIVHTVDDSVPEDIEIDGTSFHKAEAHFHPNGSGGVALGGLTTFNSYGNTQQVIIGGGAIPDGGTLTAYDFFLHERNFEDADMNAVKREFTLVLTPIPEPSTVVLMAIGLFGLACLARRARRPASHA